MTVSHSDIVEQAHMQQLSPKWQTLSIPLAPFLQSPEKRHNSAVPGNSREVWPQFLGVLWALGSAAGAHHRGWCLMPYTFISGKANYVE